MINKNNLEDLESHFEFGSNWNDFSSLVTKSNLNNAKLSFKKLGLHKLIKNKSFLDIGCGSGLNLITSLEFGVKKVCGIDIDPDCIKTSKKLLSKFSNKKNWDVYNLSIFDKKIEKFQKFDVVYSWGVLHHTGDMYKAIDKSMKLVKYDGYLCLALYQKTPFCSFLENRKKVIYEFS